MLFTAKTLFNTIYKLYILTIDQIMEDHLYNNLIKLMHF